MTKAELEARVKELETMVDTLEQEKAFINKVNNNFSNTDFDNKKKLEQFEQFKRDVFRVGFRDQFAVSGYPIHLDCEDLIENLEVMYKYYETCINEKNELARKLYKSEKARKEWYRKHSETLKRANSLDRKLTNLKRLLRKVRGIIKEEI